MIRSICRGPDGQVLTQLNAQQLIAALEQSEGLLWVDFQAEPNATSEPMLRDIFRFHPLSIDDALQESHVPRVDDWQRYLYLVLHAVQYGERGGSLLQTMELDLFLGANFVVTHHDQAIPSVDEVWERCPRDERLLQNGAGYLVYELADRLVMRYMPVIEAIDDAIDAVEVEIFDRPQPQTLENLFMLKQAVIYLRRIIAPQREVFNRLARDDYAVVDVRRRVYFRDVYDHLVRLHDTSEGMRDLVGGTVDTYLSVINNRLSDVMKTLTIITTLFMPMSFLASLFGMNFFAPPQPTSAWTGTQSLLAVLGLMALLPGGMYLWLRHRGWM